MIVDYQLKRITLKIVDGDEIIVVGEGLSCPFNIISATVARRLIRKDYETFLTYVVDTRRTSPSLHDKS